MRQLAQAVHGIFEVGREVTGAFEQLFFFEHVETGQRGRAGQRVAGVGIAVKQLYGVFRSSGHHAVVNAFAHHDGTHRHAAVGQAFGKTDDVRNDAEFLAGERRAEAAETGNHFIEYEQDAVLVANLA